MRIGLDGFLCATDLLMIHAAHHCHPNDLLPEYCLELIFQQINTPNPALVMILRPITSPLKPSFRVVDGVACLVHRGAIWQVAHIIHKDGPGQRRSLVKTAWTFATNIWVNPGVLPMIKLAWTIGVKNPTHTQTNKETNKSNAWICFSLRKIRTTISYQYMHQLAFIRFIQLKVVGHSWTTMGPYGTPLEYLGMWHSWPPIAEVPGA